MIQGAIKATPQPVRWFYRCDVCLSIAAHDSVKAETFACECGGKMDSMGHVHRFRVFDTEHRCPCDGRCTGATGPDCECQCGGENHGTGRLVAVLRDVGPIPVMRAANMEHATAFRTALDAARQRLHALHGPTIAAKERGDWVSDSAYWAMHDDRQALAHAKRLKTHKGRLSALAKVCAELARGEVRP